VKLRFIQKENITRIEMIVLIRQFATLIASGIPIIKSCDILANSQEKQIIRLLIHQIKHDILRGNNLYDSLRRHPRYFDELTCRLVQIGEQTGKIETLLFIAASYQEKDLLLHRNIKQALFYPCIITITSLMIVICMFLFVIPRFAELFQDRQNELPLLTIAIFYLSNKLRKYAWLIIILVLLPIGRLLMKKKSNRLTHFKHVMFRIPIFRNFLQKIILARFARHFALTIAAGIPMTNALLLTANSCGNPEFTQAIILVTRKISSGLPLHQAMAILPLFPVMLIQMVKIGEESGKLEDMVNKFADFTEADIEQFTQRLNLLLEPLIMIVLGVLIGGLVIGMYLPIFKLGSAI
jgi:type IV pilus assembly protein PilC